MNIFATLLFIFDRDLDCFAVSLKDYISSICYEENEFDILNKKIEEKFNISLNSREIETVEELVKRIENGKTNRN